MLKAEILKNLREPATLAKILHSLPWQGTHRETVRRYLSEITKAQLVLKKNSSCKSPIYMLSKLGKEMVQLIEHVDFYGQVKPWELYKSNFDPNLVDLALNLGILELWRGHIKIVTSGCGGFTSILDLHGIPCSCGNFVRIGIDHPKEHVNCSKCGRIYRLKAHWLFRDLPSRGLGSICYIG